MPIAILSDVHANLEALEVVLADIRRRECDRIVCLGDFVGYGPNPNECVDLLSPLLGGRNVAGHHDWAAVGKLDITFFNPYAQDAILWTQQALRLAVQQYLTALPTEWSQDGPLPFLAVHASPRNPIEEYVLDAYTAGADFLLRPFPLCFFGAPPMPARSRAACAVLDGEAAVVRLVRLEYPLERTQEKMRREGLPPMLAERLSMGR